jgi:nitrite reductase (NADH) large subunit
MMGQRVVIIGSGAAGVSAAKALRTRDAELRIDIYSDEEVPPYFRPSLSFAIAQQPPEPRPMNPPEFYREKNIGLHLNMRAEAIDRTGKKVRFADGSEESYDFLLLATGASCFIPPIPGVALPEAMSLRDHRDLVKLMALLERKRHALIVGCGVLGLELSGSLLKLGHRVTMIETAPTILPRQLDAVAGEMYMEMLSGVENLEIILGSGVQEILGADHVEGAVLADGSRIDCDLVMISAGARANRELAEACGLNTDRGILVGPDMVTNDPAIFAAGDCVEIICRTYGLQEPAIEQGRIAAARILGDDQAAFSCGVYGATLTAFGVKLFSAGATGGDDCREFIDREKKIYRKIFLAGGRVVGGILLGDTSRSVILKQAIAAQLDGTHAAEAGLF